MIIGLTGGIATGKTTISQFFHRLGAKIVDADKIAHEVLKKGNKGWEKVLSAFEENILNEDGEINRSLLGKIIFNNPEKKRKLEEIVHPIIIKKIKEQLKELKGQAGETGSNKVIILDAPLLYETGLDRLVDQSWVVYTDKATQLRRLQQRDDLSLEEAHKRIKYQIPLEEKCRRADRIINNNGDIVKLQEELLAIWREINED